MMYIGIILLIGVVIVVAIEIYMSKKEINMLSEYIKMEITLEIFDITGIWSDKKGMFDALNKANKIKGKIPITERIVYFFREEKYKLFKR